MRKIYITTCLLSITALALAQVNSNLHVDIKNKFTNQTTITWEDFEDVNEACKGITNSKKYGGKYIQNYGCAYWDRGEDKKWICLVFTKPNIQPEQFGLLMSHCYSDNVKK